MSSLIPFKSMLNTMQRLPSFWDDEDLSFLSPAS